MKISFGKPVKKSNIFTLPIIFTGKESVCAVSISLRLSPSIELIRVDNTQNLENFTWNEIESPANTTVTHDLRIGVFGLQPVKVGTFCNLVYSVKFAEMKFDEKVCELADAEGNPIPVSYNPFIVLL